MFVRVKSTLRYIDIRASMTKCINALYTSPTVAFKANRVLASDFSLPPSSYWQLNITIPMTRLNVLRSFYLKWASESRKYLRVFHTKMLDTTFHAHFSPLLTTIRNYSRRWLLSTYTWFRWKNILKMNVLPRLLYVTLPIPILSIYSRWSRNLCNFFGLTAHWK